MRIAVGTITIVTGLLLALGLTMLHSIGMYHRFELTFFHRQCQWLVLGLVIAFLCAVIDYRRLRNLAYLFLAATAVLLVLAHVPGTAAPANGGWRWVNLGPIRLQPSELTKVALIMSIAAYADSCHRKMHLLVPGLIYPGAMIGFMLVLVLAGRDVGTTALLAMVSAAMLFGAGTRLRYLIPVGVAGVLGLAVLVALNPERRDRIEAFLNPALNPKDAYQTEESKIAIGSGGTMGRGLGNGLQKSGFVPEQQTDFIFSVIAEELGLRVTLPLVAAYLAFCLAALRIARRAPDAFGSLLAFGTAMLVGWQTVINLAVVTGSVPNKGLALPFVSYGGSCLIAMLMLVGLLINVAIRSGQEEASPFMPQAEDRDSEALQNA